MLWPPGVRGVAGLDTFSGSVVWDEHVDTLEHKDREGLAAVALANTMKDLELRRELEPLVKEQVQAWTAALPDAFVYDEPDAIRRADDLESAARILFAAERQIALLESLLATGVLNKTERRNAHEADDVYVPFLKR